MKNILLSFALLLLSSCTSLNTTATTYPLSTAYALAQPIAGRVVDLDESEELVEAEEAIELMDEVEEVLSVDPLAVAPMGGPLSIRFEALATVHDEMLVSAGTDANMFRIWSRSSMLLVDLVTSDDQ